MDATQKIVALCTVLQAIGSRAASFKRPLLLVDVPVCLQL